MSKNSGPSGWYPYILKGMTYVLYHGSTQQLEEKMTELEIYQKRELEKNQERIDLKVQIVQLQSQAMLDTTVYQLAKAQLKEHLEESKNRGAQLEKKNDAMARTIEQVKKNLLDSKSREADLAKENGRLVQKIEQMTNQLLMRDGQVDALKRQIVEITSISNQVKKNPNNKDDHVAVWKQTHDDVAAEIQQLRRSMPGMRGY